MNIGQHIHILKVPMGPDHYIHPVVIEDPDGLTLVDTGMLGEASFLEEAMTKAGLDLSRLKRILITHQDIDHIGNVTVLADQFPEVEIFVHRDDVAAVTGLEPSIKFTPERISKMPQPMQDTANQFISKLSHLHIARVLEDGDRLPYGGGLEVIHTPGHTPGHISLYFPSQRLVLAADAMRVIDGELVGPAEALTPDMNLAIESLTKLAALPVEQILCYHGGLYSREPQARIAALAGQASE
ncbi:MBL fold metallo-hydrolase [Paenibacillus sp. JX-17]|uniref:MBL fold metallo-hydrolase n=1 Tax=Paenibacillus lacisoli TaxID=3064525 RepID=A0ABT9CHD2_9BACL|nr:MBL fold metallo-hydrolase [Paenibacillus sp. JX-17]MDO7908611.1 MBL fold metallo-hydrolase [Paenibacillus sp. JX-17]